MENDILLRDTVKEVIAEDLPNYLNFIMGKADLSIEIKAVSDGTYALGELEKARKEGNPYGIVLTDNKMPRMRGIKLIKEYEKHISETKFAMMTGDKLLDKERSYINDLRIPVLYKPFKPDDILNIITALYKTNENEA